LQDSRQVTESVRLDVSVYLGESHWYPDDLGELEEALGDPNRAVEIAEAWSGQDGAGARRWQAEQVLLSLVLVRGELMSVPG
jgi:hypothetical protein